MFYTMYLDGLCKRRQWPEPLFQPSLTRQGWHCIVRVNNREYSTDGQCYTTEALARDAAATRAYMICRNFSVNDGMYPGQKPGGGAVQGMPVAIGVGRKGKGRAEERREGRGLGELREEEEEDWKSWTSGGSSPRSVDSGVGGLRGVAAGPSKRSSVSSSHHAHQGPCSCRRAPVLQPYSCCQYCLRDAGWLPSPVEWRAR